MSALLAYLAVGVVLIAAAYVAGRRLGGRLRVSVDGRRAGAGLTALVVVAVVALWPVALLLVLASQDDDLDGGLPG